MVHPHLKGVNAQRGLLVVSLNHAHILLPNGPADPLLTLRGTKVHVTVLKLKKSSLAYTYKTIHIFRSFKSITNKYCSRCYKEVIIISLLPLLLETTVTLLIWTTRGLLLSRMMMQPHFWTGVNGFLIKKIFIKNKRNTFSSLKVCFPCFYTHARTPDSWKKLI